MADYTPGVCNIDAQGQRQRLIFGIAFLVAGLLIAAILIFVPISIWWMAGAFLFFWAGMLGILQASAKFCVSNAAKAQYEVKGKMTAVQDPKAHRIDQRRAQMLHLLAFIKTLIITAITTLIVQFLRH